MKVYELIEALKELPQDAEVTHLWDGCARINIEIVYLSKSGLVVTSDYDQTCYGDDHRPVDAPSKKEQYFWSTPQDPSLEDME